MNLNVLCLLSCGSQARSVSGGSLDRGASCQHGMVFASLFFASTSSVTGFHMFFKTFCHQVCFSLSLSH